MLGSHRDQWEACAAAWRFVHCLAIVEGGKTTEARGSSSSPSRPRKAPKCVRREYVLSVSLRFHGFCAWQNRNCQSEYCLRQDPPPLDLSFWSFLTFLHHGIEEVERHLLWKFYKKIRRKSWSNVRPKLVACIGFLYKVVHKIGRLRKFNRSRGFNLTF